MQTIVVETTIIRFVARLADEIKSKPFSHPEEEAILNIMRTADVLTQHMTQFLKPSDLSGPQYNVLRILRGSPEGLSCRQIGERMISRDPDVTRLLDRLESRGAISRERGQDRRVVIARITGEGMALMDKLDPLVAAESCRQLGGLGDAKLQQLIELLEEAREAPQESKRKNESYLPD